MASNKDLNVKVSIESVLQKEIIDVVQKMQQDYGITVDNIEFTWAFNCEGKKDVVKVQSTSSYEPI